MDRKLPLSILIVDDHRLFRQGLKGLMSTRPDLVTVVGEAATAEEAVRASRSLQPDLVLMDISMPGASGLEATATIRREVPNTAVVMLTSSDKDEDLQRAVRLGAAGYLLKDLDARELFDLIGGIARGEAAMTRAMAARLLKGLAAPQAAEGEPDELLADLTEREIDVLRLVARGASNREIADALTVTINTVKTHLHHILEKLEVENRTQAATYAVQKGLIVPFDE